MRLNRTFRLTVYLALAVLFMTGIFWLQADAMKDSADSEVWQSRAATLLMIHGGVAMLTLMLLGALVPLHILRAWRARRNRFLGVCAGLTIAILIFTAFALYYVASDVVRPLISDTHLGFGIVMPIILAFHIWRGRRI